MTTVTRSAVLRLAQKAIQHGASRPGLIHLDWDVSGDCTEPRVREFFARADRPRPKLDIVADRLVGKSYVSTGKGGDGASVWVTMTVRCRRCSACLRQRSRQWAARAITECREASRTWFGTLTLKPEWQARVSLLAAKRAASRHLDLDALSYKDQFVWRHRVVSEFLTKYLKRVRKESGSSFKYLLVAEAHKSGLPHYHVLIHEQTQSLPVKKDTLQRQWPFGFTQFKLVDDPRTATYVCKYLSKTAAARVRASSHYGYSV